nr:putative reverse transcriptase domain-containing protein [Tanacetum cinerariifolium]
MMDEAHASRYLVHPGTNKTYYNLRDMYGGHADIGESSLIRPELVQETTDKVVLIKEKLKAAGDRQKSYADNRRKPLEFEVGDQVLLKVSSWKDVVHFREKEMLAPRDMGPFEIIKGIHCTDSNLHVLLKEIKVDKTLRFVEESIGIINREVKSLKRSRIMIVKSIRTRSKVMRIHKKTKSNERDHLMVIEVMATMDISL